MADTPTPATDTDSPDELVSIVHPTLGARSIQRSKLDKALAIGFREETPGEAQQRYYEKTYGDQPVAAFLGGALNTITLGGSNALFAAGDPESTRELNRQNPVATTVGEIAGAFVPFGGAGIAAGAGSLAERGAGALLGGGESLMGRVVTRAVTKAAGLGAEGAVYGLGQGVSEVALSEDPMSTEQILSHLASSALHGAEFGAGLGAAGSLVGDAARAAKVHAFSMANKAAAATRNGTAADEVLAAIASKPARAGLDEAAAVDLNRLRAQAGDLRSALAADRKEAEIAMSAWQDSYKDASGRLRKEVLQMDSLGRQVRAYARKELAAGAAEVASGEAITPAGKKLLAAVDKYGLPDALDEDMRQILGKNGVPTTAGSNPEDAFAALRDVSKGVKREAGDAAKVLDENARKLGYRDMAHYMDELEQARRDWLDDFPVKTNEPGGEAGTVAGKAAKRARGAKEQVLDLTDEQLAQRIVKNGPNGEGYVRHIQHQNVILDGLRILNPEKAYTNQFFQASADILRMQGGDTALQLRLIRATARMEAPELKALDAQIADIERAAAASNDPVAIAAAKVEAAEGAGMTPPSGDDLLALAKAHNFPLTAAPEKGSAVETRLKALYYEEAAKAALRNKGADVVAGAVRGEQGTMGQEVAGLALGAAGFVHSGPWGALGGYRAGKAGARILGKLWGAKGKASQKLAQGLEAFLRLGPVARRAAPAVAAQVAKRVSYAPPQKTDPKDPVLARAAELTRAATDAAGTKQRIHRALGGLWSVDPKLADQLEQAAWARVVFLAAKVGQFVKPRPPSPFLPARPPRLSDMDRDRAAKYMAAAEDPSGRLADELAHGRLSRETVETAQALAPQTFAKVKADLVARIPTLRQELPLEKRLLLGTLFGVPVDPFQETSRMAAAQAFFAKDQADDGEGFGSKNSIGSVKLGQKTEPTPAQSLAGGPSLPA